MVPLQKRAYFLSEKPFESRHLLLKECPYLRAHHGITEFLPALIKKRGEMRLFAFVEQVPLPYRLSNGATPGTPHDERQVRGRGRRMPVPPLIA
jgi:hypothetical protein